MPEKIRLAAYDRDSFRCRWCGTTTAYSYALHHIFYRSQGGRHTLDNLILLCEPHHRLMHSNKGKFQPILVRLLADSRPITGIQLMRWESLEGS